MEIIDLISFLTNPQMINGKYDLLESYNKAKGNYPLRVALDVIWKQYDIGQGMSHE